MSLKQIDFRSVQSCLLKHNIVNSHKLPPRDAYIQLKSLDKKEVINDINSWYLEMFGEMAPLTNHRQDPYINIANFFMIFYPSARPLTVRDIPKKALTEREKLEVETSLSTYALLRPGLDYYRIASPIMGHENSYMIISPEGFEILTVGTHHKTIYPSRFYLRVVALFCSWLKSFGKLEKSTNLKKNSLVQRGDFLMRLFNNSGDIRDIFAIVADNLGKLVDYAINNYSENFDNSSISTFDGPRCSICLDSLERGESKTLPCGHGLHVGCLSQLCVRSEKRECPLCRVKF